MTLHLSVTLNYFVSTDDDDNSFPYLEDELAFRLGYDKAEIPFSDNVLSDIRGELSQVLPNYIKLNRVGGQLNLDGKKIKNF